MNPYLLDPFQPFLRTKVAGWMWGHEHNLVLYKNDLFGLTKGRLVGASAFEERLSDDPYKVNYPQVPYLDPTKYQLKPQQDGYYPHSYALIDFANRPSPTSPVSVSYYSFPSWYHTTPPNPTSTLIYQETFALPNPTPQKPVMSKDLVTLSIEGGTTYVSKVHRGVEYYPTAGSTPATQLLRITQSEAPLLSGQNVWIESTDPSLGNYKYLYVSSVLHWAYYYVGGLSSNGWRVHKLDTSVDNIVHYGNAVYLENDYFRGQTLCPTNNGYFTTTKDQPPGDLRDRPGGDGDRYGGRGDGRDGVRRLLMGF